MIRSAGLILAGALTGIGGVPVNRLTVHETGGSAQTSVPVTVGRPFWQGEIRYFPQAGLCMDATCSSVSSWLTTQADVKTRWFEDIGAVAAATNTTPVAITTSKPHGLATGARVRIFGCQGNTAANGEWTVTVTGTSTFSLNGSTPNGNYLGGGRARSNQNGSVQWAILTFILPSLSANGQQHVTFREHNTGNNTGFLTKTGILAFNESAAGASDGWNVRISALANGETKNSDARTMINALSFTEGQLQYWLQGSLVTSVVVEDASESTAFDFGWHWNGSTMAADLIDWTVAGASLSAITVSGATATATVTSTGSFATSNSLVVYGCTNNAFNGRFFASAVTASTITYTVPTGLSGQTCNNTGAGIRSHRHKSAHPVFVFYFYPGINKTFVEYRLENLWTNSVQDQTYTTLQFQDGTSSLATWWNRPNQYLLNASRLYKYKWIGAAPAIRIDYNREYLMYTRMVPLYDHNWTLNTTPAYNAYNAHPTRGDMPSCAAIPCTIAEKNQSLDLIYAGDELRLMMVEPASWLASNFDQNSTRFTIGADANGRGATNAAMHLSLFMREGRQDRTKTFCGTSCSAAHNTKYAFGRVYSKEAWNALPFASKPVAAVGDAYGALVGDDAHIQERAYLPALLTGYYGFHHDVLLYGSRSAANGSTLDTQEYSGKQHWSIARPILSYGRAYAGQLRTMFQAALLTADNTPEKEFFNYKIWRNIEMLEGLTGAATGAFPPVNATCPGYNRTSASTSAWCWGYWTVGGWTDATATETNRRFSPIRIWSTGDAYQYGTGNGSATPINDPEAVSWEVSPWLEAMFQALYGWMDHAGYPITHARREMVQFTIGLQRRYKFLFGPYSHGIRFRSAPGAAPGPRDRHPHNWEEWKSLIPLTLWDTCHTGSGYFNYQYFAPSGFNVNILADNNSDFSSPEVNISDRATSTGARNWPLLAGLTPGGVYYFRAQYTTSIAGGTVTSISANGTTATVNWDRAHNQAAGTLTVVVSGAAQPALNGQNSCTFAAGGSSCSYPSAAPSGNYVDAGIQVVVRAKQPASPGTAFARRDRSAYCSYIIDSGYVWYGLTSLAMNWDVATPEGDGKSGYDQVKADLQGLAAYPQVFQTYNDPTQAIRPRYEPARAAVSPAASSAVFSITAPTAASCTVKVDDNSDFSSPVVNTSDGGAQRWRQLVAAGLAASTLYYWEVQCADDPYAAGKTTGSFVTAPVLAGNGLFTVAVGPGPATVYLDHDSDSNVADGATELNGSCASGCAFAVSVPKGVRYYRLRRSSVGATLASVVL